MASKKTSWFDEGSGYLIRPYAITGGRTQPNGADFPLITQVATTGSAKSSAVQGVQPELVAILDLCRERPLAIVEIAALLDLPASVVKVLCGDLLAKSLVAIKTPGEETSAPSVELLERVIRGIRKL
ncbi:hypothetical protein GCM10012287_30490 [Streptomyces daqingensis]|uniref:DUF742 domain-containing protein n=1 Tax=Streptomyces daqingensis TaxID=1472640 RepID=A0ABQ2MEB7_9ACTN|nr:DUF742 domain-containing protein [Streptomyces daqingensis]GGO50539.1 hypothetical protein GCM10012287_30490 [Streptomyces daqingensis]